MKHLKFLHYFQISRLAFHNVMDAERKHEIPELKTKDSL